MSVEVRYFLPISSDDLGKELYLAFTKDIPINSGIAHPAWESLPDWVKVKYIGASEHVYNLTLRALGAKTISEKLANERARGVDLN